MVKPGDPTGPGNPPPVASQGEHDALNKVKLKTFGVVPTTVDPYGTVTATWDVTVPNTGFDIAIRLNGQVVANSGSETFKMATQQVDFTLAAVIDDPPLPLASRILRTIPVIVNSSGCQQTGVTAATFTYKVKTDLDAAFSGGGNFSLKDGGSTVTAGDAGLLDIHIPITIDVPDWFDAEMDIHIELTISGADGHVFVAAPVVDPTASFSGASSIFSAGCSDAVSLGMTKMAYAFLERIVDNELRPAVTQQLEDQVNQFTTLLENNDAQHRTFAMTTLIFSANEGLLITACPQG